MNFAKSFALVGALLGSIVAASANLTPLNITVQNGALVNYSTLPANYGDSTVLNWLTQDVLNYNALTGSSLGAPIANPDSTALFKQNISNGGFTLPLTLSGAYSYIFLHWGGQAGPSQAYYIGGYTGDFTFNAPGQPPEVGGISFYSLYGGSGNSVPDGGATVALLGGALALVSVARRKLKA